MLVEPADNAVGPWRSTVGPRNNAVLQGTVIVQLTFLGVGNQPSAVSDAVLVDGGRRGCW